ncbi:MAG: DUF4159 domain-containing protein [Alphaproteobacteria bacterium]|jgi:hypothetical protein
MLSLGPLAFGAPWVLLGLAVLPVIWWLLRVTPPAPRRVAFPAVRLLLGLPQGEETPARTPLWLLALRMLIAALVILALADPYLNPQIANQKKSAIVIVVDNGWAAAARWDDRVGTMQGIAAEAERDARPLVVVPTAPGDLKVRITKLSGAEAQGAVKAIAPQPYGVDRLAAIKPLADITFDGRPDIIWLSDGLDARNLGEFISGLRAIGDLRMLTDGKTNAPLALAQPRVEGSALAFRVIRGSGDAAITGTLKASGSNGRFLASREFTLKPGETETRVLMELATELRNDLARVEIVNRTSAGSTVLIDERWRRRPVGLVSGQSIDSDQPLLSDVFYLDRALQPYAEIHQGPVANLIQSGLSVLMLADVGQLVGDDHKRVTDWVERGGVLVRFAGPRMAARTDDLIPGRLRTGGRLLGSAMSWEKPQSLAEWPEGSPFQGLPVAPEVTVSRQVLTDPSAGTDQRTWAQLTDGTPLVTATPQGKGWLVLFHVTANTGWSNLPLSGLFVDMLRRTIALSVGVSGSPSTAAASGLLSPVETLDGFGRLGPPATSALQVRAADLDSLEASPKHPPGFYGDAGSRRAFNLFKPDARLQQMPALPKDLRTAEFGLNQATELKYDVMILALLLALGDLVIGYFLRGLLPMPSFRARGITSALLIGVALTFAASSALADDAKALKASLQFRLAYVQTGDPQVDAMSKAGMAGLTRVLSERTSVEPADPVAVDVETDELAFFPLLYWPIAPTQTQLSANALAKVDAFMRNGGTILFDTRDQGTGLPMGTTAAPQGTAILRRLLAGLDVPLLEPLTQEHIVSRTFYLLDEFPGRWASGRVWVESRQQAADGTSVTSTADGVSPIIVGGADWASAWAEDAQGRPIAAVVPGGERQRELAMRFGVNLVMYALTGNYKADLVHVPHILERLGKDSDGN